MRFPVRRLHSTVKAFNEDLESWTETDIMVREAAILGALRRRLWDHPALPRTRTDDDVAETPFKRPVPTARRVAAPPPQAHVLRAAPAQPVTAHVTVNGRPRVLYLVGMRAVDEDAEEPRLVRMNDPSSSRPRVLAHRRYFLDIDDDPRGSRLRQLYPCTEERTPVLTEPLLQPRQVRPFVRSVYTAQYDRETCDVILSRTPRLQVRRARCVYP